MLMPNDDFAANQPGDAIRRKLAELEPSAVRRCLARWSGSESARELRSWQRGLAGERYTARRLRSLGRDWHVLHAVQYSSGTDVDHLVIGPGGVFSVNSKHHKGKKVWYGDRGVTVNGASTRHIPASRGEARKASAILTRASGFAVEVRPVLAVVGAAKITVRQSAPPVLLVAADDLARRLSGLPPVLLPAQVNRVYAAARSARTWSG
ncbi:nuclease-related domain-containing protein [Streptomyces alkaliterrae]|uniref:nuclease-related domain-containing protein n=1 Tax=Streptomyces alkaliterrae TaxID=2213162 RepID=UPI001E47B6E7|nr:nuclease-related domain-containing protein [Streptomyces alkaliterrae]